MPTAGDPFIFGGALPISHSPLQRLSFNPQKPPLDPATLAAAQQQAIETFLELLDAGTGLDLVTWWKDTQALLNFINAALQQSWLNFQQFLNGLVQDIDVDVAGAIAYINGIGTAADEAWTLVQDFLATGNWNDLSAAWTDLVQAIFGSSTSLGLVGQIPAPAVVNVVQNLQPVFDFPDVESVSAGAQWSWDGTHDHTGVAGSGSAKVVANGVLQALRGTPGAVQPGQVITASAWVSWSGLVASGSPIQLELIPSSRTGSTLFPGSPVTVASIASPASSGSWTHLTGTYTVPPSGVDAVQLRLVVTGSATAGSVWWDDCEADVSGGFLADMQADTNNIIDSFSPGGTSGEFVTGVQNLLALFGLSKSSLGSATDLTAFWTAVVNDFLNPLNALEVQATKIIGDIEISAIDGLASLLSGLLGTTTFQLLVDSVANALGHSGTGHTITQIETYLGLIPPTNVTNVLGGANLGADVSSVHSTASNASNWSTRLTNALLITSDVFHLTYQAGSTTDPPGHLGSNGKPTWYSAWNDLLSLAGVVNSTTAPTDAAPAVASAITTAQSTANTAQTTLNTTNTNLFGSTTPGTQITTGAVPSGISATKISNVLGGANLGADVSSVNSTTSTHGGWFGRLTNDLTILLDFFHVTYTSTQWTNAWNDLMALFGATQSVATPSNPSPTIGTVVSGNTTSIAATQSTLNTTNTNLFGSTTPASQITTGAVPSGIPATKISNVLGGANLAADVSSVNSSATTAGTNASTAIANAATAQTTANNGTAWSTRLTNNLLITSDVFHLTYAAGSPSDTPTTIWSGGGVGNGKRTWYSAWNDLLALAGVVNSTAAPTDAAPALASTINTAQTTANTGVTNAAAAQSTANTGVTNAATAQSAANTAQDTATGASGAASSALNQLTAIPQQNVVPLTANSGQPVALLASGVGTTATGIGTLTVTWTDTIPSTANYLVVAINTATTHGATFGATWVSVGGVTRNLAQAGSTSYASSGDLTLFVLANPPTGAATFRMDVVDSSSLFSMASATSLAFKNVASVSTAASNQALNSNASLSTSFTSGQFVINAIGTFGTANSNVGLTSYNRTQRYHAGNFNGGSQFNMDLVAGTVSGVNNPSFTATVANTANEGFAALAIALSPPPTILGSYARASRNATTSVVSGAGDRIFPTSTFDNEISSDDITVDLSTNKFTVAYAGTYLFKVGVVFSPVFSTQIVDGLCYVNGQLFERSQQFWYATSNITRLAWETPVYLNAGDYVQPGWGWASSAANSIVGESTGSQTYASLSLLNRSLL